MRMMTLIFCIGFSLSAWCQGVFNPIGCRSPSTLKLQVSNVSGPTEIDIGETMEWYFDFRFENNSSTSIPNPAIQLWFQQGEIRTPAGGACFFRDMEPCMSALESGERHNGSWYTSSSSLTLEAGFVAGDADILVSVQKGDGQLIACTKIPIVLRNPNQESPGISFYDTHEIPYNRNGLESRGEHLPAELGTEIIGACADGRSRVLLKIISNEPGTVYLNMGQEDVSVYGGLTNLADGMSWSVDSAKLDYALNLTPVAVNGQYIAYAVYHLPESFPGGSSSDAYKSLEFFGFNDAKTLNFEKTLRIYRAPLFLIHGLWADSSSWSKFKSKVTSGEIEGYKNRFVYQYSYKNGNHRSWNPERYNPILQQFLYQKNRTIRKLREEGIVCRAFDLVGHSMGGLIARSLVVYDYSRYNSDPMHFTGGFINKLVTVGTPHEGSPLAAWLWQNKDNVVNDGSIVSYLPGVEDSTTLQEYLEGQGKRVDTAVEALIPGSMDLGALPSFEERPYQAVVGVAPDSSTAERLLNQILNGFGGEDEGSLDEVTVETPAGQVSMGGNGNHDTIVKTVSQEGDAVDLVTVQDVVHAYVAIKAFDTSETDSSAVWSNVAAYLNDAAPGSPFRKPAAKRGTCDDLGAINLSGWVELPADTIDLTNASIQLQPDSPFTFEVSSTEVIERVILLTGDWSMEECSPPYEFTIIGQTYAREDSRVLVLFSENRFALVDVPIVAEPDSVISLAYDSLVLARPGLTEPLTVSGITGLFEEVDITTLCSFSSNSANVSVDSDGVVQGLSSGDGSIRVSYGDLTVDIPVQVGNTPEDLSPYLGDWNAEWTVLDFVSLFGFGQ